MKTMRKVWHRLFGHTIRVREVLAVQMWDNGGWVRCECGAIVTIPKREPYPWEEKKEYRWSPEDNG